MKKRGALQEPEIVRTTSAPNPVELPKDLPCPVDDGLCDHLTGMALPNLSLTSTTELACNLSLLQGRVVMYLYPMTGKPGVPLSEGWLQIPGAPGCTPQSCAFRDHADELRQYNCSVFGISTQSSEDQREAVARLHLPYELLSDAEFKLTEALRLPTFVVEGKRMIKRQTWIVEVGKIIKVFYPVFPPERNASDVIAWLDGKREAMCQS
ncbi:peroxiredoxin [Verminephrobacter aporrectodeae subsp. tuberculatae]|uniref:peroxiredoxin n=2 Tax=Verminephrobacter aporrectodeae TaxID=1110389 RepID=UPI0022433990|nr:peroxiredoxin [Verminephrobacter aporrectodeae]MCW8166803.1 peroxiredoxin [Verminephrobacter aporrectodeae subsp. tuberculatae]MCW8170991.1 peroxiredoxin [Verminephrobacter aporrectodeae subsp. tuberculatae]